MDKQIGTSIIKSLRWKAIVIPTYQHLFHGLAPMRIVKTLIIVTESNIGCTPSNQLAISDHKSVMVNEHIAQLPRSEAYFLIGIVWPEPMFPLGAHVHRRLVLTGYTI